jgi:hypothetical protein
VNGRTSNVGNQCLYLIIQFQTFKRVDGNFRRPTVAHSESRRSTNVNLKLCSWIMALTSFNLCHCRGKIRYSLDISTRISTRLGSINTFLAYQSTQTWRNLEINCSNTTYLASVRDGYTIGWRIK